MIGLLTQAQAKAVEALMVIGLALLCAVGVFSAGWQIGSGRCEAAHQQKAAAERELAHTQALDRARAVLQRAATTGHAREVDRAGIDAFFNRLAEENRLDTPHPVDACELPADRLRRWTDANVGPGPEGAAPGQPDRAASAPAATGFWAGARLGSQPPAGGPRLSPVGEPAVPSAGVPGSGAE